MEFVAAGAQTESHVVTASVCWSGVRGGPCEARRLAGAVIRVRVEVRGFQNVVLLSAVSVETEPRTPELLTGAEAENIRAFRRWIQR